MNENLNRCGRGYIEVNLENIVSNAKCIHAHIGKDAKIVAVIKTDGYGHGSIPLAKKLEELNTKL